MKKLSFNYALCIMNCALMLACSSDDGTQGGEAKYITVAPTIGAVTRTTTATDGTQAFASGDQISVYAWTGEAKTVADLVVNNSINTCAVATDGTATWTASPQMLWKDQTSAHYFLGVYPKREITNFTADTYTLDTSNQEQSDLLVANKSESEKITATTEAVPLTFNHAMARLTVNLNFRNQWGGTPTVTAVKATAKSAATINYTAETTAGEATAIRPAVTATGDAAPISLPSITANSGYALSYQSIMVPQSGFTTIAITIDGKDYTFTNTADISLASGMTTTVNLIVGRTEITLGTVSINGWTGGTTINGGEAQNN